MASRIAFSTVLRSFRMSMMRSYSPRVTSTRLGRERLMGRTLGMPPWDTLRRFAICEERLHPARKRLYRQSWAGHLLSCVKKRHRKNRPFVSRRPAKSLPSSRLAVPQQWHLACSSSARVADDNRGIDDLIEGGVINMAL